MDEEKKVNIFSILARIIAAVLLFWALDRHPYGYYQFLRLVTCGVGAGCTVIAFSLEKTVWVWVLGIITVFFNPIIPIHLNREIWAVIDVFAGVVFLLSIFFVRLKGNKDETQN